jgi:hypothetical protein
MEAADSYETLLTIFDITLRTIKEDSKLHIRCS